MNESDGPAVLDREGPWTEDAWLALTRDALARGDGRVELVDGALLVGPGPNAERTSTVERVREAIAARLPDGLRVVGPVALRLGPDCVLVPDLAVTRARPDADGPEVVDAADALMVVEVVGREHGAVDRVFKPQVFARGRIPYSVMVEHDDPAACAAMIIGGRYHDYATASGGEPLVLEEPFPLEIPLGEPVPATG